MAIFPQRKFYIGTSGWVYKHWRGRFYPEDLAEADRLSYYANQFSTVELNTTFYHLPLQSSLKHWVEKVPRDFVFAIKASRYITHQKKLHDVRESTRSFLRLIKNLKTKAGPVLFQLPPFWKYNGERLESFLKILPKDFRYTFELRNPTWWNAECYELLKKHRCAFCLFELNGVITPDKVTTDFVYIRLHGPGKAYRGRYSDAVLKNWAKKIKKWISEKRKVFCYFDNDEKAFAAYDALRLRSFIEQ